MVIDNKKILTFFKIKNDYDIELEYVLYSIEPNTIYLANVLTMENGYKFSKPNATDFPLLKQIIQNLISVNPNDFVFIRNKYQVINDDVFSGQNILFEDSQKIILSDIQFNTLTTNKYLKYPNNNISNLNDKDVNTKNNIIAMVISIIFLLLFFGFLIINTPNFINIALKHDMICFALSSFNFVSIFSIAPNTYIIFQLSILIIIPAAISYCVKDDRPILFYIISSIVIFLISLIYFGTIHILSIKLLGELFTKLFVALSLINALIFSLVYYAVKGLTSTITELLNINSFIAHYAIFLSLFLIIFIGVVFFYDYYLYDRVIGTIAFNVVRSMI